MYAVLWSAAAGYVLFLVPFEISETVGNLVKFQVWPSAGHIFLATFTEGGGGANPGFMRAWSDATSKLVFDLSGGHYFLTYRLLHFVFILLLMIFLVRLIQVRSSGDLRLAMWPARRCSACTPFTRPARDGTEHQAAHPGPLPRSRVPLGLAGALAKDLAALALTFYAVFSNELGLSLGVCFAAAYLVGFRGVSGKGVLCTTAVLALYLYLGSWSGTRESSLTERSSGFGFRILDPPELIRHVRGKSDPALRLKRRGVRTDGLPLGAAFGRVHIRARRAERRDLAWPRFPGGSSLLTTALMGWSPPIAGSVESRAISTMTTSLSRFDGGDRGQCGHQLSVRERGDDEHGGVFYALAMVPPMRLLAARLTGQPSFSGAASLRTRSCVDSLAWTLARSPLRGPRSLRRAHPARVVRCHGRNFLGRANLGEQDTRLIDELRTEMLAIPILRLSFAPRWVDALDPLH